MSKTPGRQPLACPVVLMSVVALAAPAWADGTVQTLPFAQNWSNRELITANDNWSGVPGIEGFRGDGLTTSTGVDPQTVIAPNDPGVIDVNANLTNPDGFATGGVTEFHLTDDVVALQGSGTARAPYLRVYLATSGATRVRVRYNLRDLDGSADNSIQRVALHYRIGDTGDFMNVTDAFVPDASTGPSLAVLVTRVIVLLPAEASDRDLVQIRIMTTDAVGSDEWIGIDDLFVTDCGDGVTSPGEACDDGVDNGATACGCQLDCTYTAAAVSCADGDFCNGDESCDGAGNCAAEVLPCDDDVDCTDDLCDEEFGCLSNDPNDANCDDGLACNGEETCDPALDCQAGPPVCDDGVECTLDSCSEPGICDFEPLDSRCDDSNFCNGDETCDIDLGCLLGVEPDCSDGVDCTADECNAGLGTCVRIPDDDNCDDSAFCNGPEVCHPTLDCQPGTPPVLSDGVTCTADTCDEAADAVVHAPNDSLCNDSNFCNGVESCHATLDCQPGTPPVLTDGVTCTVDSCNEGNDTIEHTANDSLCDDNLFCNGDETCDALLDCQSGTAPDCDDAVDCTDDSCDEDGDACTNVTNDASCDDLDACNGAETCDAMLDCVDGAAAADGVVCGSDSLFCTGVEACEAGACVSPGDPCGDDVCDETDDACEPPPPVCGNGALEGDEECDDGEDNSDTTADACRTDCLEAFCGDGLADTGEDCDDGDDNSDTEPGACRTDCVAAGCGDGVRDPGETCDNGDDNSDIEPGACRTDCTLDSCGDGAVDDGEACDDGGSNSDTAPNACRTSCEVAFCGDGVVDDGEACDDGTDNGADPPALCSLACAVLDQGDAGDAGDAGGDASETDSGSSSDEGCCAVVASRRAPPAPWLLLGAAALVAWQRRRRRSLR